MRSIRIEFLPQASSSPALRLFSADGELVGKRMVEQKALDELLKQVDKTYFRTFYQDPEFIGQQLFRFLDGEEGWLRRELEATRKSLELRIDVRGHLAHLPWELLHDGTGYQCPKPYGAIVPVRQVGTEIQPRERANRPLRLLFMACDPVDGASSLSYEQEETRILNATRSSQLEIEVEESGSLEGLQERWNYFGHGFFDVLHLTGHAVSSKKLGPVFAMENDEGYKDLVTPERLSRLFGETWPRLIFLSGCETGKAEFGGTLPSFCEDLVQAGAPAVLGWALEVRDDIAILAAQHVYEALSAGRSPSEALVAARAEIYQFEEKEEGQLGKEANWHCLRLYGDGTPAESFVTSQGEGRAKFAPRPPAQRVFLDAQSKQEVCSRDRFVGRRRAIQRGLRTLRAAVDDQERYAEGFLILGMGGLGKTSLAVRLCERLKHRRFVNVGWFDEHELLRLLSQNLEDPQAIEDLQQARLPLATRLRKVLRGPLHQNPAIIVLDDFEQNVETEADGMTPRRVEGASSCALQAAPLAALTQLLLAIRESGSDTRVIITCRYDIELPAPIVLRRERLQGFRNAELSKKLGQLEELNTQLDQSTATRQRILHLADGNPRLLERLNRVVADPAVDTEGLLDAMEQAAEEFREEVLLGRLVAQQPEADQQLLAALALIQLPIPWKYFDTITGISDTKAQLQRSISLGLIESSMGDTQTLRSAYISRLVAPLLEELLTIDQRIETQRTASRILHENDWRHEGNDWEVRFRELLRLAIEGQEHNVAAQVGSALAHRLYNQARFQESVHLCQQLTQVFEDFRVFMAWARAEAILGSSESAVQHYKRALQTAPPEGLQDDQTKEIYAATLNNMARIIAQQGDIPRAMELWEQSLQIHEAIRDAHGKATTLHQMAGIVAQQGDIPRATNLWRQSLQIKEAIGDAHGKAATLNNMAVIVAQQGDVQRATNLWEQSLQIHEAFGDTKGKATTLNNMAGIVAQQGDIPRAMSLWEQSLQIHEAIRDAKGRAATLHNMAGIVAQQGDIPRAMKLWEQSLQIHEAIGDTKGKAATLAQMAWAASRTKDHEKQRALYLQSAQVLGKIRALGDLITVVENLGASEGPEAGRYLAQAFWLSTRLHAPVSGLLNLAGLFVQKLGADHELSPWIAGATFALIQIRGQEHPEAEKLQQYADLLLLYCAAELGIPEEDRPDWIQTYLNPQLLFPTLFHHLEEMIGDTWFFDPALVPNPFEQQPPSSNDEAPAPPPEGGEAGAG